MVCLRVRHLSGSSRLLNRVGGLGLGHEGGVPIDNLLFVTLIKYK